MTAPTVAVTIDLSTMTGEAAASVTVTARMDRNDAYTDGFVLAEAVSETTNASGVVVLDLFPNDPDAGLGTQGSTYLFSARVAGTAWHYRAQIPNSACNLQDLTNLDSAPATATPGSSVRTTLLTGLSTADATAVTGADTILAAIGKLQAQINAITP